MRLPLSAVLMVVAMAACIRTSPERAFVNEAAAALGRDPLEAVRTMRMEGSGEAFSLGQNARPGSELPGWKVTSFVRSVDFANRRWRQELLREPRFPTSAAGISRETIAVDNGVAFDAAGKDGLVRRPEHVGRTRHLEVFHHPVGILQAALDPATQLRNLRSVGHERGLDIVTADGIELTLFVEADSGLPSRVLSRIYHPNLGDVFLETTFADYERHEGIRLPRRLAWILDRYTVLEVEVEHAVNLEVGDLSAPDDVKSAAVPPPMATVEVNEVADGVWHLTGESHHSVVVELDEELVLIEAPASDVRAMAVIDRARRLRPDKPLTAVINTHHHLDHSAGIRAAVAAGLKVVTHALNARFLEDLVSRPHRLETDALETHRRPLELEAVAGKHEIGRDRRRIEIYPIQGSPHADTLLMMYLPAERVLVVADAYSPAGGAGGASRFPFAANLLENIQTQGLRVARIVPIHGAVVPFTELVAAVDAERSRAD